jgi:ATP-binding protein involved in chromosome partitioning
MQWKRRRHKKLITQDQIREALKAVQDPELKRSIVDLRMVKGILVKGGEVQINLALTTLGCPMKKRSFEDVKQVA